MHHAGCSDAPATPVCKPGELPVDHTYTKAGTYAAKFTVGGGFCSPRPASATTTVSVEVAAPTG
jgi:hypothetical protein